jgi:hypothetical protein
MFARLSEEDACKLDVPSIPLLILPRAVISSLFGGSFAVLQGDFAMVDRDDLFCFYMADRAGCACRGL